MRIKRAIAALLCIMMLVTSVPAMSLSSGAATVANTGGVCFSVSADGNTFTITRSASGELPRQDVIIRTVNLTAFADIHFEQVYQNLFFDAGEDTKTVTVNEYTSEEIANNRLASVVDMYQSGTTREYRFDVIDTDGFLLASATRQITYSSSYAFNNEYLMESDGYLLLYLDGANDFETGEPLGNYLRDPYVDVKFPNTSNYTTIQDVSGNGYEQGV